MKNHVWVRKDQVNYVDEDGFECVYLKCEVCDEARMENWRAMTQIGEKFYINYDNEDCELEMIKKIHSL